MKKALLITVVSIVFFLSGVSCTERKIIHDNLCNKRISVVFSPGGLGDSGYNDLILEGFQRIRRDFPDDVDIMFYMPDSLSQARDILVQWLEAESLYDDELFVLASSDYEDMLRDVFLDIYPDKTAGPEKDLMLLESYNRYSLPVRTLRIASFGASYMAGVQAATEYGTRPALVMAANPYDRPVLSAVCGFIEGWKSASSEKVDTVCMSADWNGFIQSDKAYQKMHEWCNEYGFVFPVAGGTNNGIYKYLRENPGSAKTAGMDVDQSFLCADIIGSVLKHLDNLIYDSLQEWIVRGDMCLKEFYGLEDGYSEWDCPDFPDDGIKGTAVIKEHEYETR